MPVHSLMMAARGDVMAEIRNSAIADTDLLVAEA